MSSHEALLQAFRAWDAAAMAVAARAMIEQLVERTLDEDDDEDRADLEELAWVFRELLEGVQGHPNLMMTFVCARVTFIRTTALALQLGVAHTMKPALMKRWAALGYPQEHVSVPRADIAAPVPLKGEPGYGDVTLPSIHVVPDVGAPPVERRWARGIASATTSTSSSTTWLKRYRDGEHEAVWREMRERGAAVRADADSFGAAVAVALETMRRAREAIEMLHERLSDQGYAFMRPDEAFLPPEPDVDARIGALEERVGALPLSLCAFLREAGSVDFCGEHPDWTSPGEAILDPLVVSPTSYLLDYEEERWQRYRYALEIAPDAYHKEDISGGPPYTLTVPCALADDVVLWESSNVTLVELLRRSLHYGGFPGWSEVEPRQTPHPDPRGADEGPAAALMDRARAERTEERGLGARGSDPASWGPLHAGEAQ